MKSKIENEFTANPGVVAKLEKLTEKLEAIQLSPEYILANQAVTQAQKDNFEMLDRSLTMIQAVHGAESKNSDFYTEIIKFLLPLFATAAIAGATITVQNINSVVLMAIGIVGVIVCFGFLAPLLTARHRRAARQRAEYEKIAKVFETWQSIADIHKKAIGDIGSMDDARDLANQFSDIVRNTTQLKDSSKKSSQ